MDWNRIDELLDEASQLPAEARTAFLKEACGDDAELLALAMTLVEHIGPSQDLFSSRAEPFESHHEPSERLAPGRRIGRYRLIELLGEGGMGEVWLVEQEDPVRRRVALKVIKLGMDSKEVVARFESERQALAVMDHPGIARVLDGGMTAQGRPYFVMEIVKGVPITEYCDTHRLDVRERVRLFVQVCHGIQHAHTKGVMHRDLKPSNVLVGLDAAGAVAKVIDFGIAKAMSGPLTDKTLVTSMGQIIGTPVYMSPEQASGSGLDVDFRTDVYALGVVLYELLVGALPFSPEELRQPGLFVQLRLRTKDAPTPSTRLAELGETQRTVARARRTDPTTLRRELRGDLDWIVMKAMEKDRTRRYESVSSLGEDLQRYLRHEPVVARPPSTSYRIGRFVRRNRAVVAATGVTAAVLVAGIIGTSLGLVRARAAEAAAQQEAETAQEVASFLTGLFQESDPYRAPTSMTTREVLDRGAERVRSELGDQPIVQARLMHTIGTTYRMLELFDEAKDLLEEGLTIRERELGPDHVEVGQSLLELAGLYRDLGMWDDRVPTLERAWTIFEAAEGMSSRGVGEAMYQLADHHRLTGNYAESAVLFGLVKERLEAYADQDAPIPEFGDQSARSVIGRVGRARGLLYLAMGRLREAEDEFTESLENWRETRDPGDPLVGSLLADLGRVRMLQDRPEDAYPLYREAMEIRSAAFGPWDSRTADALLTLGGVAERLGRLDEAEALFRRALAITDSLRGPESGESGQIYRNLGDVALARGDHVGAERHFRTALGLREQTPAPGEADLGELRARIAEALEGQGRIAEAADLADAGLDMVEEQLGAGSPGTEYVTHVALRLRLTTGDTVAAERRRLRSLEAAEAAAVDRARLVNAMQWLAAFYRRVGRLEEAHRTLARAIEARAPVVSDSTHSGFVSTEPGLRASLAEVLGEMGRWDEALIALTEGIDAYERSTEPSREETRDLLRLLERSEEAYLALGRAEEASAIRERARSIEQALDR